MPMKQDSIEELAKKWAMLRQATLQAKAGRSSKRCQRMRFAPLGEEGFPGKVVEACRFVRHPPEGDRDPPATWCQGCRDAEASHSLYRLLLPRQVGAMMALYRAALESALGRSAAPAGDQQAGGGR